VELEELEKILSLHPFLPKPKYIVKVDELLFASTENYIAIVKGATPMWRRDMIVVTPLADHETVVHEVIHTLGFGELAAEVGGRVLSKLRDIIPPIVSERVSYELYDQPHPKVKIYRLVKA